MKPGSVVAVSEGTTAYEVAARLRHAPGLTVVTNSLPVADLLRAFAEEPTRAPRRCCSRAAPPRGRPRWWDPWRTRRSALSGWTS
ncbi:hypothetical protein [Streptomyces sp. adm13(2018)]|uniref:hypothetical protein n=1 Tax=Streptomyces sp. adm13(2018) TaxID=2479007 RepID=UPI002905AF84|nr:hypothetical protein [Streptomyces sp. adm13(2018)]